MKIPKGFASLLRYVVDKLPSAEDRKLFAPLIEYAKCNATLRDTEAKVTACVHHYDGTQRYFARRSRELIFRLMDRVPDNPKNKNLLAECKSFLEEGP